MMEMESIVKVSCGIHFVAFSTLFYCVLAKCNFLELVNASKWDTVRLAKRSGLCL